MFQKTKIDFQKERDFSSVLSDTIEFLKQNFKPLFGSIIFIAGPLILVMGLIYAYVQSGVLSASTQQGTQANNLSFFSGDYYFGIGLVFVAALLAYILVGAVTFNYMCLYKEKNIDEKITVSEVTKRLLSNIKQLVMSSIALIVFLIVAGTTVLLIGIGLFSEAGDIVGIIVLISLVITMIVFIPISNYFLTSIFFIVVRDDVFVFTAMGKVKKYLSGSFWRTWLIMSMILFILGFLQIIFNAPSSIYAFIKTFTRNSSQQLNSETSSILLMVLYTITVFLTYCSYAISHVASAFNYLSHEEKHEGNGLLAQIESI